MWLDLVTFHLFVVVAVKPLYIHSLRRRRRRRQGRARAGGARTHTPWQTKSQTSIPPFPFRKAPMWRDVQASKQKKNTMLQNWFARTGSSGMLGQRMWHSRQSGYFWHLRTLVWIQTLTNLVNIFTDTPLLCTKDENKAYRNAQAFDVWFEALGSLNLWTHFANQNRDINASAE